MAQPIQHVFKPLRVSAGFEADQRRNRQSAVELLRFAVGVPQLQLADLSRLRIENCNLLPTRMEITPYNSHEGFS